jgi:malonate decarboxylase beta subunit
MSIHSTERHPRLSRQSFLELLARERAMSLLDPQTFRELLDPFERLESPWLELQGIVPASDDGAIVARGLLDGEQAVVVAIEGAFQGGSIGEVSGAKIAGALELALQDCEQGRLIRPVLVFESGGVRLQEANLGLNAIAEICSALIALRRFVPVVGIIDSIVGCFGGTAIVAGLCSYLIATREGRLGLNGPEVIEQEGGIEEFDARDRPLIWSVTGGEQRYACGLIDELVEDDVRTIRATTIQLFQGGLPTQHRSEQAEDYCERFADLDLSQHIDAATARAVFGKRGEA